MPLTRPPRAALLLGFALLIYANDPVHAWDWPNSGGGWAKTCLGTLTGIAIHELGHITVAKSQGIDYHWDGWSIVYDEAEGLDRWRAASGGFQAQWVMAETVFALEKQKVRRDFSAGMILGHIGTTAAYLTILKDHEEGDLYGMEKGSGIHRDKLAAYAAIPALLDTWRLFDDDVPSWVPLASIGAKGFGIWYVWQY